MNNYYFFIENSMMDFEQQQWVIPIGSLQSFDLSPDLQNIAYSQYGISYFTIIKLRKQVVRKIMIICPSFTFNLRYSPNGELLASTASKPNIIYVWNIRAKKLIGRLECRFEYSFVFQPDRNYIYTHRGDIEIWQTYAKMSLNYVDAVANHVEQYSKIQSTSVSPSGRMNVTRINYNTGKVIEQLHHRKKIQRVLINDQLMLSQHYQNSVSVWYMRKSRLIRQLKEITGGKTILAISPNKKLICYCSSYRDTRISDLETAIKYKIPSEVRQTMGYAKFSYDSKFLIQRLSYGLLITPLKCCTPVVD